MTNDDELLKHLDINHNHEAGLIPFATQQKIKQADARIRELKAEVEALKHDLERYVTIASLEGDDG